jgi:putative hydrolase
MILAVPLDEDWHVHSTFSDGASTLAENVAAARAAKLRRLCLTDHVRGDTTWLPDYVTAVDDLRAGDIDLLTGVETKVLDTDGHLDLPADLSGVELVLIADHQFPARHGPVLPSLVRTDIEHGVIAPEDAAGAVADALTAALGRMTGPRLVLAHLFSILPKLGTDEAHVPGQAMERLTSRAAACGAALEINEKWSCPSPRTVRAFASAGVPAVAGSDSHDSASIGRFSGVRRTIAAATGGSD